MSILKRIARRILNDEMQEDKTKYNKLLFDYNEAIKIRNDETISYTRTLDKLKSEINELNTQVQIMHKYYDLDKEPTDEEKIKIRIDLKIHDLEMQLLKERKQQYYDPLALIRYQQITCPYPIHFYSGCY